MTLDLGYTASVDAGAQCTPEVRTQIDTESDRWESATADYFAQHRYPTHDLTPLRLWPENVSRDLCRYLAGPRPPSAEYSSIEALESRAVFHVGDRGLAAALVDGAVLGICPEFTDQRDELVALLD